MKYSKSTNGFYLDGQANTPPDSTDESKWSYTHAQLLEGQSAGKRIVADENGYPILIDPPGPTQDQVIADYESALDAHLDSVAKEHRFKDRHALSLRAAYDNAWQSLGAAYGTWMDACNVQAYALLQDVLDGNAEVPTKEAFIASLPVFVAP